MWPADDPTELKKSLINGCSKRTSDMRASLGPVQAWSSKASAQCPKLRYINIPAKEKLLPASGDIEIILIRRDQQPIALEGVSQAHSHLTGQVIVAGPRITDRIIVRPE